MAKDLIELKFARFKLINSAFPGATLLISLTESVPFLRSLQAMITLAPNLANSLAVSKPIPVLEPVTIATYPVKFLLLELTPPLKNFFKRYNPKKTPVQIIL